MYQNATYFVSKLYIIYTKVKMAHTFFFYNKTKTHTNDYPTEAKIKVFRLEQLSLSPLL